MSNRQLAYLISKVKDNPRSFIDIFIGRDFELYSDI